MVGLAIATTTTTILFLTFISSSEKIELQRLLDRDPSLSMEQAQCRISTQMSMNEKRTRASMVVDNSGDLKSTVEQIQHLLKKELRPTFFSVWLPLLAFYNVIMGLVWFTIRIVSKVAFT